MKANSLVFVLGSIASLPLLLGAQQPGLVHFTSAAPTQVLEVYRGLSGLELIMSSHIGQVTASITVQPQETPNQSETLKVIERALVEQAGIVITRLDGKRASVTYNDALLLKHRPTQKPVGRDGRPISPPAPPPGPPPVQK